MRSRIGSNVMITRWKSIAHPVRLFLAVGIALMVIVPSILSEFGYDLKQTMLAIVLMEVCLYPTVRYFARNESGLPAMPILCLAYALQFALPIFTHDATIELSQRE